MVPTLSAYKAARAITIKSIAACLTSAGSSAVSTSSRGDNLGRAHELCLARNACEGQLAGIGRGRGLHIASD
jgi:hypothetical protein